MWQRVAEDPLFVDFVVFLDGFSLTTLLLALATRTPDDVKLVLVVQHATTRRTRLPQERNKVKSF